MDLRKMERKGDIYLYWMQTSIRLLWKAFRPYMEGKQTKQEKKKQTKQGTYSIGLDCSGTQTTGYGNRLDY